MSRIRSTETRPERSVRRFLFARGFRFRKNLRTLPGTPDIVLRKYRTVIFVNGCFWHGHEECGSYRFPKSNVDFWRSKIERNKARDLKVRLLLRRMGWHVIQIWECQLKPKVRETTLEGLEQTLYHIYLLDRAPRRKAAPYSLPAKEELPLAAEGSVGYGDDKEKG